MSKTNIVFTAISVVALVLACVSIHNSTASSGERDIEVRLEILEYWVDDELREFAEGREFNSLEYSYLIQIAEVGWTAARMLRECNYEAADNMLVHSSHLIDDYIKLKYGD